MTQVFKLFSNIIPVRGHRRSTLCDLQRGRIKLIPNDLFELLTQYENLPLARIQAKFPAEDHATIASYYEFLLDHEWGFMTTTPERFPKLDLAFAAPHLATNAIIDVDCHSDHDFAYFCAQLEALGCPSLQIRVFCAQEETWISGVLEVFAKSKLRNLEIWLPDGPHLERQELLKVIRRHPRVYRVVLHSSQKPGVWQSGESRSMGLLVAVEDCIESADHCGQVDRSYFLAELYTFAEAKHFNSCLHRKISIDSAGQLRNCPSLPETFGAAEARDWKKVMAMPDFQSRWSITKDQVKVCQDCEFRYVCTDCRAFTENNHPLGKPAKCGYDPYSATWLSREHPAVIPV